MNMNTNGKLTYAYKFSIVIAVYNVEPFLKEAIDSIIKQDIGFIDNVQIILIDDGSNDNSASICDSYHKQYPQNIIVRHKKNAGVSAARNDGLKYIEGEYVNFLDGDDRLSTDTLSNVYKYFDQWKYEINLVTIPLVFFEGRTGQHILNDKFNKGSRVIHLNEEPNYPLLSLSASFVKNEVARNIVFDECLVTAEDAKVIMEILLQSMHYGVVKEAVYWYRRRLTGQRSAIQSSLSSLTWYKNYMDYFALWAIDHYSKHLKYIPPFVQYTLMYDLQWRFLMEHLPHDILSASDIKEYKQSLGQVLQHIENKVILCQQNLSIEQKLYVLKLKYLSQPRIVTTKNDLDYYYLDEKVYSLSALPVNIAFITLDENYLEIEGFVVSLGNELFNHYQILSLVDNKYIKCYMDQTKEVIYSLDDEIARKIKFKLKIPLQKKHYSEIKFFCQVNDHLIEIKNLKFQKFSPLQNAMWNSYYVCGNFILTYLDNKLILTPYSLFKHVYRELSYLKGLYFKRNTAARKAIILRSLYHVRCLLPQKEVWLISDRVDKADDNGEMLFRFLKEHPDKKIYPVYAIAKTSRDYTRMKQYGKIISFGGWRYKWLYLCGAKIISSQGEDYVYRPFLGNTVYYSGIVQNSHFVFLQHGVIINDLSHWLNRFAKNIHLFVTTTDPEKKSILEYNYQYSEKQVKLAGLPRHDFLYHDEKKYITIAPTWRSYLVGEINSVTGKRQVNDGFERSCYCINYSSLLTNKKLIEAAKKYGYTIRFISHPNMDETTSQLQAHSSIQTLSMKIETYRKIFAESSLLVTDYSSIIFDFAYLRKPSVYFQFDKDEFFVKQKTYDSGYFDYGKNGFGEVEFNSDEMVERLIEYMANGCQLKDLYRDRIEQTFPYSDQENCLRVYKAIKNI